MKVLAFIKRHAWWLVPLIIADIFLFRWLLTRSPEPEPLPPETVAQVEPEPPPPPPPGLLYTYPTDQRDLWNTESTDVYQPTASGRIESALFGSTRTRSFGGRLLPAFHMGIDLAPLRRDNRGRPLDEIYAVADGRIAYVNRVAGNSNYGIYIVVLHEDPMGEIYTLYAHLARVAGGISEGTRVARGDVLGIMGNTASTGLPMHRAHLHFEIGVIKSHRFEAWYRTQNLPMVHGRYHGFNMTGIDPLTIYGEKGAERRFSMLHHLPTLEPAFSILIRANQPLDYFTRYPGLWHGDPHQGPAMVLTVSEAGVPLSGRTATAEEADRLGRSRAEVLEVNETVLGRNGRRHIVRRGGNWVLGRAGERWLAILTH